MKSTFKICCACLAALLTLVSAQAQRTLVTKIAAGGAQSLFIRSDGSLWGMGDNVSGELGLYNDNYNLPTQIVGSNVTTISAGQVHSLFRQTDGSLWGMGENAEGQLGLGAAIYVYVPVQIATTQVGQISAGGFHSLFAKFHNPAGPGSLWGMGYNSDGELGDGGNTYTNMPEQILFLAHSPAVSAIAAGFQHSLVIKPDGSLWANGSDEFGQLGDGNSGPNARVDSEEEIEPGNVTAIAAGADHSLFLKSDGSLWAMGYNYGGAFGDGTTNESDIPKEILSSNVTAIAAGEDDSLILKADGSLWAAGLNYYGELGDGTTSNRLSFVEIVPSGVTAIAAGTFHNLFIKSDGSLWGMGRNNSGQLGDGTYNDVHQPELILGPPPALAIVTYSNQPVVLFPSGRAYGYVLQMRTNLESGNWVTVTNGIPFSGVQLTNASNAAFFRFY